MDTNQPLKSEIFWLTLWGPLIYVWKEKPNYDFLDKKVVIGLKDHNTKKEVGSLCGTIRALIDESMLPKNELDIVEIEVIKNPSTKSVEIKRRH